MPEHRSLPRTGGRVATAIVVLGLLFSRSPPRRAGRRAPARPPSSPVTRRPPSTSCRPAQRAMRRCATPGVRIIARYKRFLLVEAAPSDARDARRRRRRAPRRHAQRPAPEPFGRPRRRGRARAPPRRSQRRPRAVTGRRSSSCSSSARRRTTGSRGCARPACGSSARWPRTRSSSTPRVRRGQRCAATSRAPARCAARSCCSAKDKLAPQVATSGRVRVTVQTLSGEDGERARERPERLGTTDGPGFRASARTRR